MEEPLTLPYDIYCLVVDILAAEDGDPSTYYSTLCACALTSPSWTLRAHFHLYRRVVLPTRKALLAFARTVADSPQLAPLVEHIDVKVSPAHDCGWPRDHRQVDIPFPPAAVARMAALKSARFSSSFQFAEAPASLVAFVRAFAACGTLRKVGLHRFFFPEFQELATTVWSFPRMASLSVVECGWCTPRSGLALPDADAYPARCHSLSNLLVSKCCAVTPILDIVRTSIHELSLWASGDRDHCPAISAFSSLRRITMSFSTLQWAIVVLAHVRSEHVREIKMKLGADCLTDEDSLEEAGRLDEILSRAPFQGLRRLTVMPGWADAKNGRLYRAGWTRDVQARLPQCHARGILRVPAQ